MRQANETEKEGFKKADLEEFQAILNMKAVRVISGKEAAEARQKWPHRIITSRMVRRKKPLPGVGDYKFKSRCCIHGHKDPDGHELQTYSPTPSVEAITLFLQVALCFGLSLSVADIKNAFCQSNALEREQGPLFVLPCEGLDLSSDALIQLVAPVYGLNDAPLKWRETLVAYFQELDFQRSLLEPCWLVKRNAKGEIQAQVLIEVDGLLIAASPDYEAEPKRQLEKRFVFGKFESGSADFAGRSIVVQKDCILLHQEKYIVEKVFLIKISRGSAKEKSKLLDKDLFEQFRSLLYKINWVAHQTRPEAAGIVSILSTRLRKATYHDLMCLNKIASHLRNTAQQCLTLHRFGPKTSFIVASGGGVDGKPVLDNQEDTVQGAWVVLMANKIPSASFKTKVSIISWRSAKLRRRVSSTLASEALAFSQSLGEVEWLQIMFRDIVHGDVNRTNWQSSLSPFVAVLKEDCELKERLDQCAITDAKSLYDSVSKNNPTSRQKNQCGSSNNHRSHEKCQVRFEVDAASKDDC